MSKVDRWDSLKATIEKDIVSWRRMREWVRVDVLQSVLDHMEKMEKMEKTEKTEEKEKS